MIVVEKLDWDSHFFKKEIGRVVVDQIDLAFYEEINDFIAKSSYDLIYLFEKNVEHRHNPIVEESLKDTKVVYQKTLFSSQIDSRNCKKYINSEVKSLDTLYSLAIASGEYSRYRIDPKFSTQDFVKLYTKWIDNTLNGTIADDIFVYQEQENIIGLVTAKYAGQKSEIGLIAVEDGHRGKSIGSSLLKTIECEAIKRGCNTVSVATQLSNLSACGFYEKNEYKIVNKVNIYHIWK